MDDGSTDDTREILARFPEVRAIHQAHRGLSVARNAGLRRATGTVIAYTDSDCVADPNWLIYLVHQLLRSGAAAVGGPNLTPEDGWLAACVAAAPGQPTHVLVSDQVAEHIPGCNMAFRREALEAINGFDPQFRKAGDDVDICWRLQHEGLLITFAPAAFVWHHRRQNPRSYLKQQAGYGEAEALLHSKHPDKFNGRGDGKWGGVMYGGSLQGLQLAVPIIYRGTFGTGMFQCLYQPGAAHWAMLPSTLEWQVAALLLGLAGMLVRPWGGSSGRACWACRCWSPPCRRLRPALSRPTDAGRARLLIASLCYAQPLVRSWTRYRTRLSSQRAPGLWSGAVGRPSAAVVVDGPSIGGLLVGGGERSHGDPATGRGLPGRASLGQGTRHRLVRVGHGRLLRLGAHPESRDRPGGARPGQAADPDPLSIGPDGQAEGHRRGQPRRPRDRRLALSPGGDGRARPCCWALGVRAWVRGLAAATRVIALFRDQAHQMHLIECSEEVQAPIARRRFPR